MQRDVVFGDILFPISRAREVLNLYGEWGPGVADQLAVGAQVVQPPGGAPGICGFNLCWSGDPNSLDRVIEPIRRLGAPIADTLATMDYVAVQRSGDTTDFRAQGQYIKSGFIASLPPGLADAIAGGFEGDPRRATILAFQQGGGAIGRVAAGATAFAQRDAMANMLCFVNWPNGEDPTDHIDWIRSYWEELEPFTHGFYVNDLEADMTAATVRENYRQNHDRLVAVKNEYDPRNLFRLNANVQPTV